MLEKPLDGGDLFLADNPINFGNIDKDLNKEPDKSIMAFCLRRFVGGDLFLDPVAESPKEANENQNSCKAGIDENPQEIEKPGETSGEQAEKKQDEETASASGLFVSLVSHGILEF
jgi:hypothetical protein